MTVVQAMKIASEPRHKFECRAGAVQPCLSVYLLATGGREVPYRVSIFRAAVAARRGFKVHSRRLDRSNDVTLLRGSAANGKTVELW